MRKIIVFRGHPRDKSFCNALTDEYIKGVKATGHQVKEVSLNTLSLEKFTNATYEKKLTIPAKIKKVKDLITEADHLVFSYPTWWASAPGLVKIFLEVILCPGFAYKFHESKGFMPKWDKLLKGKSSRIISTMDSPPFFYKFMAKDPGYKMMKANLDFCGVSPVKKSYFGSIKMSTEEQKKKWLTQAYAIGKNE